MAEMKTINIAINQANVNAPLGAEVVEYLVVKGADNLAYIIRAEDKKEWPEKYGYEVVAQVNVTRPAVMSGTMAEVEGDIKSIIERKVVEAGICETNDAGTLFVK